ncbi:MAG: conserved hypothetical protein [Candidatus Desulfovibrio kirbyi]|uniref:Uncharacterized protein n=1 Tax=Candidatus Desulfovibrio kirbyi TaxID=2696086 RepID=A0A6L2R3X2_9BACT|nr:MAG: conserved hypothetical protein [Candidatus Desulfovibrio kirbyi]
MQTPTRMSNLPDEASLPKPKPGKGGAKKILFLSIFATCLVGGAAFWLTRDEATREQIQNQATDTVNNLTKDTPLAGAGSIAEPVDTTHPTGQNTDAFVSAATSQESPPLTADSAVHPAFVEDLAAWLVAQYKQGQRNGTLAVSVQSINQRYGVNMTGLSGNPQSGRADLLRYVFNPPVIQEIYTLYVERFMEALRRQAAAKSFTHEQSQQLHMAVAGHCAVLASALEGIAAVSDLEKQFETMRKNSQSVVDINSQMTTIVFELDQLRDDKALRARINAAQARLDSVSNRYRKALENRSSAQRALVAAIRKGGGQSLDEDSLLFLAHWVDRRLRHQPQAVASVQAAAGILRDLARRCTQTGTQTGAQQPVAVGGQQP